MTNVKCTVSNCEYWGEGQKCNAREILVKNDIAGDANEASSHYLNADLEVGDEFGEEIRDNGAHTSPQTCCDTMKLKRE